MWMFRITEVQINESSLYNNNNTVYASNYVKPNLWRRLRRNIAFVLQFIANSELTWYAYRCNLSQKRNQFVLPESSPTYRCKVSADMHTKHVLATATEVRKIQDGGVFGASCFLSFISDHRIYGKRKLEILCLCCCLRWTQIWNPKFFTINCHVYGNQWPWAVC